MSNTTHHCAPRPLAWAMVSLLLGFLPGLAQAGDVYVIVNDKVHITADDLKDVFTGTKTSADGIKLVPIDNSAAQADFLAKVVKLDAAKYANLWAKKGFREGISPPSVRGSDAEVIANVKSQPGAVGYVSKAPPDVKVLQKF